MKYLNNPFNIRYDGRSRWLGLSGHRNGFCEFSSLYYGVRVCVYLLEKTYYNRGIRTLHDIIYTFAPFSDGNNPDAYLSFVCQSAGVSKDDVFAYLNFDIKFKVLQAMVKIESNYSLDYNLVRNVYYVNNF